MRAPTHNWRPDKYSDYFSHEKDPAKDLIVFHVIPLP